MAIVDKCERPERVTVTDGEYGAWLPSSTVFNGDGSPSSTVNTVTAGVHALASWTANMLKHEHQPAPSVTVHTVAEHRHRRGLTVNWGDASPLAYFASLTKAQRIFFAK